MNNVISVESKVRIINSELDRILISINKTSEVKFTSIVCNTNEKLFGGVIIRFGDKTMVVNDVNLLSKEDTNSLLVQSKNKLDSDSLKKIQAIAMKRFDLPENVNLINEIKADIISGVRLRYKDEEIDMTMNKIINQIFTSI